MLSDVVFRVWFLIYFAEALTIYYQSISLDELRRSANVRCRTVRPSLTWRINFVNTYAIYAQIGFQQSV